MKRLIVNADDLGLTAGVNRAVFELFSNGVLTSSTLMATATEGRPAAAAAHRLRMGVGCHVVLVDGVPVLPPSEIPSLMDPEKSGNFRPSLGKFVYDLLRGQIRESEIEAEAAAQIDRLKQMGLSPTHVDTHKHTHVFPRVLRPLLRAAVGSGVTSIRNPFEPVWSIATAPGKSLARRMQLRLLISQREYFFRAVRASGIATTDGALGIAATGSLRSEELRKLLQVIPSGTWELVCHPGYVDSDLRQVHTRLLDSREIERAALLEILPPAAADFGVNLIDFRQLASEEM